MNRTLPNLLLAVAAAGILLGACRVLEEPVPVLSTQTLPILTPYQSPTVTATSTPQPQITGTAPLPTRTPRIYTVKAGDTLLMIAFQYGLTQEQLLSANPSISPSMLAIGAQLVIPEAAEPPSTGVQFTPQPLTINQQHCYPGAESESWCLVLVENESQGPVESVVLDFRLVNPEGESFAARQVPAPLNILPAGGTLPVGAYFPPPLPEDYRLAVELRYALPYRDDGRYLPVSDLKFERTLVEGGLQAVIKGTVVVENAERLARLSVLGVGYGVDGSLLAMRLWQNDYDQGTAGEIPFDITLYSPGGEFAEIEVLAEAVGK